MLYAGLGMIIVGWIVLTFFGITIQERRNGKDYTASDSCGAFLMTGGICISACYCLWMSGSWLVEKLSQVFYGVRLDYVTSLPETCAQACVGAALLFFLSMMTTFKGALKYEEYRRHDFARARRVRATFNFYAAAMYRCGLVVLFITIVAFAVKSP